jgi:prephenate dehydrogenase
MWTDIFLSNKESILKAIDAYKDSLDEIKELVENENEMELQDLLGSIKEYKNSKF